MFKEKSATNPRGNMAPWERLLLHRPAAERAAFVIQRLTKAKPEARRALYDGWKKRGVINPSVIREMKKQQARIQ